MCTLKPSLYCNYTRGHNRKLFKLQSHLDLHKNAFTVRVVSKWNSLPDDVVNAPSVNAFKSRLDKFWLNQEVRFNYKSQLLSDHQLSRSDLDIRAAWPLSSTCLRF